jgi:CP family cyanate transporter-like MFS transporter
LKSATQLGRRRVAAAAALFFAGLALRPQLVGIGPIVERIQEDFGVPYGVAGLLGTVPILLMAVTALLAPMAHVKLGVRWTVAAALSLVAVAGLVRPAAPSIELLIIATIPIGIGIGIAGAVLPAAASEQSAIAPSRATSIYALGIQVGATVSAAAAVPLAVVGEGWRPALVAYAAFNAVSVLMWVIAWRSDVAARPDRGAISFRPERGAVPLAILFALQSFAYYAAVAWLPAALIAAGWTEADAGSALGLLNSAAIIGTVAMAGSAGTAESRRRRLVLAASLLAGGMAVVLVLPDAAFVAAGVVGLSFGLMFPLVLMLPLDAGRSATHTVRLAAAMLALGYTASAFAPATMGLVRDATGSFAPVLATLAIFGVLEAGLAWRWSSARLLRPGHASR